MHKPKCKLTVFCKSVSTGTHTENKSLLGWNKSVGLKKFLTSDSVQTQTPRFPEQRWENKDT